jgi:tetratricopeptide (TPR) repeat protein
VVRSRHARPCRPHPGARRRPHLVVRASERDARAQALYLSGRAAFESGRFDEALAAFREAFGLSHAPELLYNMASALERLGRPHEAAETYRAYLRASADQTDRREIEGRMRALEEEQRLLDLERLKREPSQILTFTPPPLIRKRTLAAVLGSVGAALVAGALGVGLGLGLREHPTATTLDSHPATP